MHGHSHSLTVAEAAAWSLNGTVLGIIVALKL